MKNLIRIIAVLLCVAICSLSFAACDKDTTSSDQSADNSSAELTSSDTSSKGDEADLTKPEQVMFDNKDDTYWKPEKEEGGSIEFSFESEKSFNSITFKEFDDEITDFFVEIKKDGEWVEILHADEMRVRTCILDKTYTAKDVRLTVSKPADQLDCGVSEMLFEEKGKIDGTNNIRNVGYYTASRLDKMREDNFDELKYLTDVILFDFGSWDKNGNFIWSETYNEEFLQDTLAELKEVLGGRKINMWFCLQNYHKASTENTGELFKTESSRKNLTKFAIDICKKYGFIGVDIDYEYPTNSSGYGDVAWSQYDLFLNYAAKELHKNGLKLSCAMYPSKVALSKETVSGIDFINIMSYDMHGFDEKLRMNSRFFVCQYSLDYFVGLGFKPEQLTLGLPFYCRIYDGTTSQGGGGYKWIINRFRGGINNWINRVDTGSQVFSFNSPDMIRDKTYFAMENQMAGVFCWCMGSDVGHDDPRSLSLTVGKTIERFSK